MFAIKGLNRLCNNNVIYNNGINISHNVTIYLKFSSIKDESELSSNKSKTKRYKYYLNKIKINKKNINNNIASNKLIKNKTNDNDSPKTDIPIDQSTISLASDLSGDLSKDIITKYNKKKYHEIIKIWKNIDKYENWKMNKEICQLLYNAMIELKLHKEIISLYDYYIDQKNQLTIDMVKNYIDCCMNEDILDGYHIAYKMLVQLDVSRQSLLSNDIDIYENVIILCYRHGKWRTIIEIFRLMVNDKISLNHKVLKYALLTCCKDNTNKSLEEAVNIYNHMIKQNHILDYEIFYNLLYYLNDSKLYDKSLIVWNQLFNHYSNKPIENKIQLNDLLYSFYVEILCGLNRFDEAIDLYNQICKSIKQPMNSYIALIIALRKSNKDIEIQKIKSMKLTNNLVIKYIDKFMSIEYYDSLLEYLTNDLTNDERLQIPISKWNEIYNKLLEQGLLDECEKIFDIVLDSKIIINNDSWCSRLISKYGKIGQLEDVLQFVDRYESRSYKLSDDSLRVLLTSLCYNKQHTLAIDRLKSYFDITSSSHHNQIKLPYPIVYKMINNILTNGDVNHLQLFLEFLYNINNYNIANYIKIDNIAIAYESNEIYKELTETYVLITRLILESKQYNYISNHVISNILSLYKSNGLSIPYRLLSNCITMHYHISNYDSVIKLFYKRIDCYEYIKSDEKLYEIAIISCGKQKNSLYILEILNDLLKEKKKPSSYLFDIILQEFIEDNQLKVIQEVYMIMSNRSIKPTKKSEALFMKYLPDDMKNLLIRDLEKLSKK